MDNSLTGQKNKRIKVVYNLVYITWSSVISLFKVQLTPGLIDSITLYIEQYLVSKPTAYCLIPRQQNEQKTKGFNTTKIKKNSYPERMRLTALEINRFEADFCLNLNTIIQKDLVKIEKRQKIIKSKNYFQFLINVLVF